MSQTKKSIEPSVIWRAYAGTRRQIAEALEAADIPAQWGDAAVIRQYILDQVPGGETWRGNIRVTGYRTPVNDKGTGTAYVSVHWEPANTAGGGQ